MSHPKRSHRLRVRVWAIVALSALLWSPSAASAAESSIEVEVLVCLISDAPGKIDPRAKGLDRKLRSKIRYESLVVLDTRTMKLGPNDVGSIRLPGGRSLHIKPLLVDDRGALLAIEWEGQMDTQMRVKSGHLVVLGPQRHKDGQIVVSLEPRF